jgi:small-conductance mechanosensitive channel
MMETVMILHLSVMISYVKTSAPLIYNVVINPLTLQLVMVASATNVRTMTTIIVMMIFIVMITSALNVLTLTIVTLMRHSVMLEVYVKMIAPVIYNVVSNSRPHQLVMMAPATNARITTTPIVRMIFIVMIMTVLNVLTLRIVTLMRLSVTLEASVEKVAPVMDNVRHNSQPPQFVMEAPA